jgi:hypothetical protein
MNIDGHFTCEIPIIPATVDIYALLSCSGRLLKTGTTLSLEFDSFGSLSCFVKGIDPKPRW